jgi:hypothetical protein
VTHAPRRRPQPEKQACTPINLSINPLTNAGTLTYDQHGGTSPPLTHQDRAGADRPGPYAVIDRSGLCLGSQILIPPRLHVRALFLCALVLFTSPRALFKGKKVLARTLSLVPCWIDTGYGPPEAASGNTQPRRAPLLLASAPMHPCVAAGHVVVATGQSARWPPVTRPSQPTPRSTDFSAGCTAGLRLSDTSGFLQLFGGLMQAAVT